MSQINNNIKSENILNFYEDIINFLISIIKIKVVIANKVNCKKFSCYFYIQYGILRNFKMYIKGYVNL